MRCRLATIIAVLAWASLPVFSCSCAGPDKSGCTVPPADVIVLAKVVSIERNQPSLETAREHNRVPYATNPSRRSGQSFFPMQWGNVAVTLSILERFRGEPNDTLVIQTRLGTAACGYPFEEGHEYLIFANEFQGALQVSYCSATQPAKAAATRIRQLRALREGVDLPVLFGSVVTVPVEQGETYDQHTQPVPSLTVVASSGEREHRTSTAADGLYEFHGLPRGEYRVHVVAPPGRLSLWHGGGIARVRAPVGLGSRCPVNFHLFWDGQLAGTVVNNLSQPMSGWITAEYVDPAVSNPRAVQVTVKDGRFEIPRLWPGRYRLTFLADSGDSPQTFYYPGTKEKNGSTLIEVGEGLHVDNLQFVIF